MDIRLSLNDLLICCTDQPLSNFEQKLFTKLFQPILSISSYNLYLSFHSLINYGDLESKKITHEYLIKKANFKNTNEFQEARVELEAMGLIDTYVMNIDDATHLYMIVLKRLPLAYEFFNNEVYSTMLKEKIGNDEYQELASSYLVHLYDINKFECISKSIDEVYVNKENAETSNWWINTNFSGFEYSSTHFDYELFIILVSAQKLLPKDVIESTELYNNINRLAWIFNLDTEKIVDALKLSIEDNKVNYELLRTNCKKLLIGNEKLVIKKMETEEISNNALINTLNNITPSVLVENKYNTKLTPSEIEMFDKLLVTTNISRGVLNVLIIYVIDTKNGEIPSYNYFLKIINTWIRKGVKNTNDALNIISNPSSPKNKKEVSPIYKKYMEELEKNKIEENDSSESLAELESFFNTKK